MKNDDHSFQITNTNFLFTDFHVEQVFGDDSW